MIERRRAHRFRAPAHGVSAARIRGGYPAAILDLATGGVCLDTARRLLPGARVDITLVRDTGATTHEGRVVRCAIVALSADDATYRAALQFCRPVPWFAASAIVVQRLPAQGTADHAVWSTELPRQPSRVHERPDDGPIVLPKRERNL